MLTAPNGPLSPPSLLRSWQWPLTWFPQSLTPAVQVIRYIHTSPSYLGFAILGFFCGSGQGPPPPPAGAAGQLCLLRETLHTVSSLCSLPADLETIRRQSREPPRASSALKLGTSPPRHCSLHEGTITLWESNFLHLSALAICNSRGGKWGWGELKIRQILIDGSAKHRGFLRKQPQQRQAETIADASMHRLKCTPTCQTLHKG